MSGRLPCDPANIGRRVLWAGYEWKIVGINWLDNYDIVRYEQREDGRYKIGAGCVLGLKKDHPHYACLLEEKK
jgi:hypothetical protein